MQGLGEGLKLIYSSLHFYKDWNEDYEFSVFRVTRSGKDKLNLGCVEEQPIRPLIVVLSQARISEMR